MSFLFRLLTVLILLGSGGASRAQRTAHTRTFRTTGTYAANLSLSPSGIVLSKSGDISIVTLLDGYSHHEVTLPEESSFRVYQSRSGQIWTIGTNGVWLYHQGAWTSHPIPEIRIELINYPFTQLHQISLLPAEVNHLLILVRER